MVDTVSKDVRSRVMRCIPSKGTKPEVLMRLALVRGRLRGWRMHKIGLPGKPDFIFEKKKLAIFIDGCFWHGCRDCYRGPKSNKRYWVSKLRLNKARDKRNSKLLLSRGWRILRLWEHQARAEASDCVKKIRIMIRRKA